MISSPATTKVSLFAKAIAFPALSSKQPELTAPFIMAEMGNSISNSSNNSRPKGYLVDDEGYIVLPVIGRMKAARKTCSQLANDISAKLRSSDYIKDASVNVQIMNFKFSVLGEVNNPGSYQVDGQRVTIFDAISRAGDLNIDKTINKLRKRAHVADMVLTDITTDFDPERDQDVNPLLWEIRRERRVELMGEGTRLDDLLKYKNISFLSSLIEYNALRKMSAVIPPLIISALLPFAFDYRSTWFTVSEKITWIYFFIALLFSVNAVLNSVGNVLMNKEQLQNRPMKGFIQIFQVIFSCVAIIVIISILINKSPLNLITGLGAFAAVLMLIFKDTILGFVAGVLLSENDMVHIGDWIEMPQNNVNGVVMDITLNIVKVQNFDNTIVTIPPYSLVSGSFINWRGMTESGGRRIMLSCWTVNIPLGSSLPIRCGRTEAVRWRPFPVRRAGPRPAEAAGRLQAVVS